MQAIFEIITDCLVQNLLLCSAFLWILCDSRNIFEISTRVGSAKGNFIQPYLTWNTRGVVRGNSNPYNDHFRREDASISKEIWIIIGVVLFIFLLMLIHCALACQNYRICLWSDTRANTSQNNGRVVGTSPPVDEVRTSVGNDVPPEYTAVVDQKSIAVNDNNGLNHYPKVVGGKKLETPPPDYITVAPFK